MSVPNEIRVGLIGDYDSSVPAHQAIPPALALAGEAAGVAVAHEWVPTEQITDDARIATYDALWCVPASPYRSTDGALRAIRFAREQGCPFLGTCGGFQHAVVVTPLECALVEAQGAVRFRPGSLLHAAYDADEAVEGYRCRYGLNPAFRDALTAGPLRVAAEDEAGDVRAVELDGHPFFVATLFQPERAALRGDTPPIVAAFLRASADASRPGWTERAGAAAV
jgi:CTP synthase (UTP-ammonia lyase)